MEMNFKKISVSDYTKHSSAKTSVDADIIVPDKKADISKILSVTALADVSERYVRKDKIIFGGNVKFSILYVGEDNPSQISSIEYTAPFNHQCDSAGADDNTQMVSCCSVYNTRYEVKNSRKLSVSANIKIDSRLYRTKEADVIDFETQNKDFPQRTVDFTNDNFVCSKDFEFSESDTISVSAAGEECEIYAVSLKPDITEIKTVNNKAVIKGVTDIRILYSTGGEISDCESEINFTEIVDIDELSSEHRVMYFFEPADYTVSAQTGEGGTDFDVNFKIRGSLCAYESCTNSLISDIYSPDYHYEIGRNQYNLNKIDFMLKHQATVKDVFSASQIDSSVAKIHFLTCDAVCTSATYDGQNLKVSGNLESNIIYSDESGTPSSVRRTTPFELEIPSEFQGNCGDISADVVCTKCGYVLNSSGEIQVRAIVKVTSASYSTQKISMITDFSADKNSPVDKSLQPSIVVCYPEKSCDLWEYAKKYNTTVDEIMKINSIDDSNTASIQKPIIIPKRQINHTGNA